MKVCNRCKVNKDDSEFRLRRETRGKRGGGKLTYLNNVCKKCESETQTRYYFQNKDNPEWLENWRKKSSDYHKKNREEILKKMAKRNATPEHKAYMIEYNKKNKDRIKLQSRARNKKYLRKLIMNLKPAYAKRLRLTAEYQIKSDKSKAKSSLYLNKTDWEILLQVAKTRLQKLLKEAYGK